MNLLSTSQVLVKSHFFFILPFFPTCSSLQGSLKILTVQTVFSCFGFRDEAKQEGKEIEIRLKSERRKKSERQNDLKVNKEK